MNIIENELYYKKNAVLNLQTKHLTVMLLLPKNVTEK